MKLKVKDLMKTDLETLTPDDTLQDAVALEMRRHIRHIPIVSEGELVGILTDRDLKRAMPSMLTGITQEQYKEVMNNTQVGKLMTRSPMTVSPDTDLLEAGRILCDKKFGGLPVIEAGNLVGILTQTDLLRAFLVFVEKQEVN